MSLGTPGLLAWRIEREELVRPAFAAAAGSGSSSSAATAAEAPTAAAPELSVVDRIAAPAAFLHQALVFKGALEPAQLRAALAEVLALFPTLACRATLSEDGEWALAQPGAGGMLTLGSAATALTAALAPEPPPPLGPLSDLAGAVFGHLPPVLSPLSGSPGGAPPQPLLHVAHIALAGGGCVLGLRVSHLVADYGTLRAALHHLARAYSGRPLAPPDVPVPAAPLLAALGAATALPPGHEAWNYRPLPAEVGAQMAALQEMPPLQGLTLHVAPAQLAALKARALADLAATAAAAAGGQEAVEGGELTAGGSSGGADSEGGTAGAGSGAGMPEDASPAWVSSNDALMAWLWRALARLPCRAGIVTPFNLALDMRPPRLAELPPGWAHSSTPPKWLYGNLATSAYCPELDAAALRLGEVALALRQTVARDAAKFAQDIAWVSARAAAGAGCRGLIILPVLRILEAVGAGRPPLLMATQWALDYGADADFGGQLPVGAAAGFGAGLLFPAALTQPAPPAAGGGVLLHLWLWPREAAELEAALGEEGAWAD